MTDAFRRTDAFRKFDNTQYNFHLSVVYEDYRKRLIYVLCMLTSVSYTHLTLPTIYSV